MTRPRGADAIVVGLGVVGSAIAAELARRGLSVIGVELGGRTRARGSSGGETRIIRRVPLHDAEDDALTEQSYRAWARVERRSGRRLLVQSGVVLVADPDTPLYRRAWVWAAGAGWRAERVDDPAAKQLGIRFAPGARAVIDRDGGYLLADRAVTALRDLAEEAGAVLRYRTRAEAVTGHHEGAPRVVLAGAAGELTGDVVVLAVGPWLPRWPTPLRETLSVERVAQFWFAPAGNVTARQLVERPVLIWSTGERDVALVPCPQRRAFKMLWSGGSAIPDAEGCPAHLPAAELDEARAWARDALPDYVGELIDGAPCMYTHTATGELAIHASPSSPIVTVSACCGRGFKHAAAIGERAADAVVDVATQRLAYSGRGR